MRLKYLHIVIICAVILGCSSQSEIRLEASNVNLKLENGVLFYNDIAFSGMLVSYYSEDVLRSEIQYEKGKKHGFEKQWYPNGQKIIERYYAEGVKTGIHKAWWESGDKKFEYHFNEKGEFHGLVKEWYKSSQLFRAFNYVNGKEVGSQKLYKNDGTIKANYEVVNGERFGLIGLKKCYSLTVDSDEF